VGRGGMTLQMPYESLFICISVTIHIILHIHYIDFKESRVKSATCSDLAIEKRRKERGRGRALKLKKP
jgi:hypothetical protein